MTLAEMYMNGMVKEAGKVGGSAWERVKMRGKHILDGGAPEAERAMNVGRGGAGKQGPVKAQYQQMADNFRQRGTNSRIDAGIGAAAGVTGAALLGGGALAARKLMAKKSLGARLGGALKKNRKALALGGAGAAGLAGLAAYRQRKNRK